MTDDDHHCACSGETPSDDAAGESTAVGVPIPDEHVGAFIAEVFEDVERSTTWDDVVERLVAPAAADAWAALSPADRIAEVLTVAADYDESAVSRLAAIDADDPTAAIDADYRDALRRRRNADMLRSGVADAYGRGYVDDEAMVTAVERADFDTATIARREEELERVATNHGFDFRPYGGTLVHESDRSPGGAEW